MSYQVLARKWRPRDFSELAGQPHVAKALVNALDREQLHHAYLFTGTRGVGKTTIARILARCLNCETGITSTPCGCCSACEEIGAGRFVDLIEVDAASRAKVDETRELMDNVQYAPARGRFKVYLIDEVHMFSGHSFNALLKTLEEPPEHVKFLLATTDPQKMPVTVLSRCLRFNLRRLSPDLIHQRMELILKAESLEAETGALRLLARAADGSMRDGLSLLDQAIAYAGGSLCDQDVRAMLGVLDDGPVFSILTALAGGDGAALLAVVDEVSHQVTDFDQLLESLLSALQKTAVAQVVPESVREGEDGGDSIRALANTMSPEDVQLAYQIGVMGRRDLPYAPDPRAGFEMIMVRMLAFRPESGGSESDGSAKGGAKRRAARTKVAAQSPPTPGAKTRKASPVGTVRDWEQLVGRSGATGLARQLAMNSVLEEETNERLRIRVAASFMQLADDAIVQRLGQALSVELGRAVRVQIAAGDSEDDTPAQRKEQRAASDQARAVKSITEDTDLQAFAEAFGTSFDEDSIRPLKDNLTRP